MIIINDKTKILSNNKTPDSMVNKHIKDADNNSLFYVEWVYFKDSEDDKPNSGFPKNAVNYITERYIIAKDKQEALTKLLNYINLKIVPKDRQKTLEDLDISGGIHKVSWEKILKDLMNNYLGYTTCIR